MPGLEPPVADPSALLRAALAEDVGAGDLTSLATIPAEATGHYALRAREPLTLSGMALLPPLLALCDPQIMLRDALADGTQVPAGAVLARLDGPARGILAAERTALNLLQHLSGIATETAAYVEAVAGTRARILDTRKTLPGLRAWQKYAVRCGGGENHRHGLYDAVLIKDNHLRLAGGVAAALRAAKAYCPPGTLIEIECDTLAQLQEVIAEGSATRVLLDNMDLPTLRAAVALAKTHGLACEASGTVSRETVAAIAHTGVDYISVGKLTHSVRARDIGLDEI